VRIKSFIHIFLWSSCTATPVTLPLPQQDGLHYFFFFVCEGGGCRTHGSGGAAMAVVDPAPVESSRGATTVEGIIVPY
jgi:hypothetical protein